KVGNGRIDHGYWYGLGIPGDTDEHRELGREAELARAGVEGAPETEKPRCGDAGGAFSCGVAIMFGRVRARSAPRRRAFASRPTRGHLGSRGGMSRALVVAGLT